MSRKLDSEVFKQCAWEREATSAPAGLQDCAPLGDRNIAHPLPLLLTDASHAQPGCLRLELWSPPGLRGRLCADSCLSWPTASHNQPRSLCHKSPSKQLGKSSWIPESHSLGPPLFSPPSQSRSCLKRIEVFQVKSLLVNFLAFSGSVEYISFFMRNSLT